MNINIYMNTLNIYNFHTQTNFTVHTMASMLLPIHLLLLILRRTEDLYDITHHAIIRTIYSKLRPHNVTELTNATKEVHAVIVL